MVTIEALSRCDDFGFATPARLHGTISLIGRCYRSSPESLVAVHRPYLAITDPTYAWRCVLCELAGSQDGGDLLRHDENIVVAGGFASWEMERVLDVARGGDGLPRAHKGTETTTASSETRGGCPETSTCTFRSISSPTEFWTWFYSTIPGFTTPSMVIRLTRYDRFCKRASKHILWTMATATTTLAGKSRSMPSGCRKPCLGDSTTCASAG